MNRNIEVIRKINQTFVSMMNELSAEQLNTVPTGFNNNIIWNFAHSLAVQQAFFYALSGLSYTVDKEFIDNHKKGTKPQKNVLEEEIKMIISLFADTIDKFEKDYSEGIFKTYHSYTTSIGYTLTNIDEAIQAASFHDGWHFGVARTLRKMVSSYQD